MHATLVVDASFCPDTGAGGWAVFATSERGELCIGGIIDAKTLTNNVAECIALAYGLQQAVLAGVVCKGDSVLCLSDSVYVRDRMRPGIVGRSARKTARRTGLPPYAQTGDAVPKRIAYQVLSQHELTLEVVFINGHTPKRKRQANHHWMAQVDALSRKYMLELRNLRVTEAFL